MMQKPVKDGGGKSAVVVEDARPFFIDPVGCDNGSGFFIAEAESLKEDISALFIYRQIAQFINEQKIWLHVFLKFQFHTPGGLSGGKGINDVDGGSKKD